MKTEYIVSLFLAALGSCSPLGDRHLFQRFSRDVMLRNHIQAPATCTSSPIPNFSNATSSADNSTFSNDPSLTTGGDNSTDAADTNTTDSSTETRRHLSTEYSGWQSLCAISGGGIYASFEEEAGVGCPNWAGIDAVGALYAEADPCEQQLNADFMITWAKEFGGYRTEQLISQAIAYRRFPRRVVEVLGIYPSTPYCQLEPANTELYGVYNDQWSGVTYGMYGGPNYPLVSFGGDETCPWGWTADSPSCTCYCDSCDVTSADSVSSTDLGTSSTSASSTSASSTSVSSTSASSTSVSSASDTATASAATSSVTAQIDSNINDPSG